MAQRGAYFDESADSQEAVFQFPARRLSARDSLVLRLFIAVSCIVITTLLVYYEASGYKDANGEGQISWLDALYYATVTLSTTGYGDIVPVSEQARLINILIITPLRFVFLIVLISTTIEVLTQAARDRARIERWRKRMKNHVVIIGFGVKGKAALRTLLAHGVNPRELVVVAADRYSVAEATREGVTGIVGDARSERILTDAGVRAAARIVVAADQDDTAIMVTLRVAEMAPKTAVIVAAAREASAAELLRQSGAHHVITTAESAGNLLGLSLLSPTVGEIMEDLLDTGRGLEVVDREITRAELGRSPKDLTDTGEIVLAVVRAGKEYRFDEKGVRVFERGDRVVVIRRSNTAPGPTD